MRTTLTLDDDVAEKLQKLARKRKLSFKEAVNATLRRGLSSPEARQKPQKPFKVRTFRSEFQPGVNPDKLNQLLDEIEIERFTK